VEVGAIIIVETESRSNESPSQSRAVDANAAQFVEGPLAFVDVLGRSLLEHTVEQLIHAGVKTPSLVVQPEAAGHIPVFRGPFGDVNVRVADDSRSAVAEILLNYSKNGCDCAFVVKPNAYANVDLADFLDFHREGQRTVTRAADREGSLDLWVLNCDLTEESDSGSITATLLEPDQFPASYFVEEYVRRITHARDFRQLVTDAFLSRCNLTPMGEQLRPGIWADDGVEIRKGARIVAPAYLGRRCTIGKTALVTRFSNIERDSHIDYGTVIENSSILPNTYIGVWLDVRHSMVHGNKLLNLERDVLVEVCDPRLLRCNGATAREKDVKCAPVAVESNRSHERSLPQKQTFASTMRSVNTTEFNFEDQES
jgi:NDP-sugar pyrophosphorylase family protein